MKVKATQPINHDGESYGVGDSFDVTKEEAADLIAAGAVRDPDAPRDEDISDSTDHESAEQVLAQANEQAAKILSDAQAEAEKVKAEAQQEADKTVSEANTEAKSVRSQAQEDAKNVVSDAQAEAEKVKAASKPATK